MKIRNSFVSNSSSTSFVFIYDNKNRKNLERLLTKNKDSIYINCEGLDAKKLLQRLNKYIGNIKRNSCLDIYHYFVNHFMIGPSILSRDIKELTEYSIRGFNEVLELEVGNENSDMFIDKDMHNCISIDIDTNDLVVYTIPK